MRLVSRGRYVFTRLCLNAAFPLTHLLRGRGPLGIDGDLNQVAALLEWWTPPLRAVGYRAQDSAIVEMGPGKTGEGLVAFALAGARDCLGLDVSLDVPGSCFSDARVRAVAELLQTRSSSFVDAVDSSPGEVALRCDAIVASEKSPVTVARYDGWSVPLPDNSVDMILSRSVLEHVHRSHVAPLLGELRRVLRTSGSMVHVIDMRDHMHIEPTESPSGPSFARDKGDWLDALTYPQWLYDAMFSRSPTLINRLRVNEWLDLFTTAGFEVVHREDHRLPLPKSVTEGRLHRRWRSAAPDVLAVSQVTLALR